MPPGLLPEDLDSLKRRVDTDRSGPFAFQIGLTAADLDLALHRVADAHERFSASPLSQVASLLEKEVVVSSVFGTNTIEGGTLSEDETANALALDPNQVQAIEQQRALNILLYRSNIRDALDEKRINTRQYTILTMLLDRGRPCPLTDLRQLPWYASLYLKLNDKTRVRDLHRLRELEYVHLDTADTLWPGFATPSDIKPLTGKKPPI